MRGRERSQCERETVEFCTPPTGDLAHNPGMCPDCGNQTHNLLVLRPALNPLSHTSQGWKYFNTGCDDGCTTQNILKTIFGYTLNG